MRTFSTPRHCGIGGHLHFSDCAEVGQLKTLQKGQNLVEDGDDVVNFFLVMEGEVSVTEGLSRHCLLSRISVKIHGQLNHFFISNLGFAIANSIEFGSYVL